MKDVPPLSRNDFLIFQSFLAETTGLFFEDDQSLHLPFALWERMQATGCKTHREYYDLLQSQPGQSSEFQELLDIITTGETYFFRGRAQFEALMEVVLPEIIEKKIKAGERSIRIWSAGCSKGNEAYSIAIAMMETMPDFENWDLTIVGTDINRNVLSCARKAVYNRRDVAGHAYEEYVEKYFEKKNEGYVLHERVKKIPRFEYHNLIKDPFTLEGMPGADIIFCRNVTIYFDLSVTKSIIDKFYDCLADGGYLFLGHAETLWQINDKFQRLEFPKTFIYKKAAPAPSTRTVQHSLHGHGIRAHEKAHVPVTMDWKSVSTASPDVFPKGGKKEAEHKELFLKAVQLCNRGEREAALEIVIEIINQSRGQSPVLKDVHLLRADILANLARYEEAISSLEKAIALDNLFLEAHYLLGILLSKIGNQEKAEAQFRKVLYVNPHVVMAYFNLGNIYLSQKNLAKAEAEFANTIKLLQKRDRDQQVEFCDEYTVEFLLRICMILLAGMKGGRTGLKSGG